jgi:outer membrane immunogenic protein
VGLLPVLYGLRDDFNAVDKTKTGVSLPRLKNGDQSAYDDCNVERRTALCPQRPAFDLVEGGPFLYFHRSKDSRWKKIDIATRKCYRHSWTSKSAGSADGPLREENMRKVTMGAIALTTLFSVGAAHAADMPRKSFIEPAPVSSWEARWEGLYAGVTAGYGIGAGSTQNLETGFGPLGVDSSPRGVVGGFTAGYNWQMGKFVFGPEADINLSDMKSVGNATGNAFGFIPIGATYSQATDEFYTARLRLGYLIAPDLLLYGTGGYVAGCGTVAGNTTIFSYPESTFTAKNCFSGTTYGGGIEKKLRRGWSVKAEYLRLNPKATNVSYLNPNGAMTTLPIDNRANIFRVGLNFAF